MERIQHEQNVQQKCVKTGTSKRNTLVCKISRSQKYVKCFFTFSTVEFHSRALLGLMTFQTFLKECFQPHQSYVTDGQNERSHQGQLKMLLLYQCESPSVLLVDIIKADYFGFICGTRWSLTPSPTRRT